MSEERFLYLTPHEKDLVEAQFKIKLRLASEVQLPHPVAHPGLKNCSVKCYMNSIIQMLYSNPYIRRQVIEFTDSSTPTRPCSPNIREIASACVKALRDLFLILSSGKGKFYDADGVFRAMNAILVERNIANIKANKITAIENVLSTDDLSVAILKIIQSNLNDTEKLEQIASILREIEVSKKNKKLKQDVEKMYVRIGKIVKDSSEVQQDADEFFLIILECMGCYRLDENLTVDVTRKRFCVDKEAFATARLIPQTDPPVKWLTIERPNQKESITTILENKQLPEIITQWRDERNECREGETLGMQVEYKTSPSFNTLFLFNAGRANLFVPYRLPFAEQVLLLKGACLYHGNGSRGHYVYADIISERQGIIYDDQETKAVWIDYDDLNVDLRYQALTLSENGYFYMYVIEKHKAIHTFDEPMEVMSDP